jgi:hypothetical protein
MRSVYSKIRGTPPLPTLGRISRLNSTHPHPEQRLTAVTAGSICALRSASASPKHDGGWAADVVAVGL